MPPAVGEAISPLAASDTLDHAMPPGWKLDGINIWPERIEIHTSTQAGANVLVQLDGAEEGAEGAGRFLQFHVIAGAAAVSDSDRKALLGMAALVDGVVPAQALLEGCKASAPSHPVAQKGAVPRWLTVLAGLGEALVLFVALAFAVWREHTRTIPRSRRFGPVAEVALFAGAFAGSYPWFDPAPLLSSAMLDEQVAVSSCLEHARCAGLGFGISIGGMFQGAAWLHLRVLALVAGLGISTSLLFFHLLNAATTVLLARTAARHGGKRIGAFTAIGCVIGSHVVANEMSLSSGVVLPAIGALLLVLAIEVVERPYGRAMVPFALLAAVAANVQVAGVLLGVSVVWVALRARERRASLVSLGLGVFLPATFVMAPPAWIVNGRYVWSRLVNPRSLVHEVDLLRLAEGTAVVGSKLLVVVVVAMLIARSRHRSGVLLATAATALAVPLLLAVMFLTTIPSEGADPRSLGVIMPAIAALAAIAVDGALVFLLGEPWPSGQTVAVYAAALGAGLVTTVAIRPLEALGSDSLQRSSLAPRLTLPDVEQVPRSFLALGWSYAHVYRSLKSPVAGDVLASFAALASGYPVGPDLEDHTNAYFLKVESRGIPSPLPSGWTSLRQRYTSTALLVLAPSALDWRSFEACDAEKGECTPSGLRLGESEKPSCPTCVKGMPSADEPGVHELELRIPLLPAPPGSRWSIAMPRGAHFCQGRVVSIEGRKAEVSPDGRIAAWTTPSDGPARGTVRILWELDSPMCPVFTYSGMPPFFLEGETDTVGLLDDLLVR